MKFSQIWIEQCEAARDIEFEFGVPQALDYLIADKFMNDGVGGRVAAMLHVPLPSLTKRRGA